MTRAAISSSSDMVKVYFLQNVWTTTAATNENYEGSSGRCSWRSDQTILATCDRNNQ
jgi:hypothetical protein